MRYLGTFIFCVAIACGSASARDRLVDGFPDLPKDARLVAERSVACQHFWGEVSGTDDERDREIAEQLKQLKCDTVDRDIERIKRLYANSPAVLGVLSEASHD